MYKTGIPFKNTKKAYEDGVEVLLHSINFPKVETLEDKYEKALVYLRNTDGYDRVLNFSGMDYSQKCALLFRYIRTKTEINIPELNDTWLMVLLATIGIKLVDSKSIFNNLELLCFSSDYFEDIRKIWEFVISLPLFSIMLLETDSTISAEGLVLTDKDFETTNFVNIIKVPAFDNLFKVLGDGLFQPKFYNKVFIKDNTKLIEAISHLSYSFVIDTICSSSQDELKAFTEGIAGYEGNNSRG